MRWGPIISRRGFPAVAFSSDSDTRILLPVQMLSDKCLIPVDVIFIIPQKIFNLISFSKYLDAKLETTCRKLWCGATPGEQTESMTVCRQRKQKVR